jgi:DNA-binding PadR family transcriptional regulator
VGNVILGLLLLKPQTLYALNKQFEQGISLFYRASYGSLQSALRSLLATGRITFVEGIEGGRNKKTYSITESGRAAFHEWMRSPIGGGDVEVAALSKLFFLGLIDDAQERASVLDDLESASERELSELEGLAAQLDAMDVPREYERVFRYQRATLDYGLMAARAARERFARLAADERRGAAN